MKNSLIRPMNDEFLEYLRDESRTVGNADSISFPRSESDVIDIIRDIYPKGIPVTIQGGRTGLAAGAVPNGGHIMNLSRMNRITAMRCNENGDFFITMQPGVALSQLRKQIESRKFDTSQWSEESKKGFLEFCKAPEHFFSPDPTEASATIGGMVSCNASGARSYFYGPTRKHITALRIVLCDGQTLAISRGELFAEGRVLNLSTEQGNTIKVNLPTYKMPGTKNASGYYIEDNMDAIDLFIGSDGTLGIVTEIEVKLIPLPKVIWGVSCFFETERDSIEFVISVRNQLKSLAVIEFFDGDALNILRCQKAQSQAFSQLPAVDERMNAAIYVEIHCEDEETAVEAIMKIGSIMKESGGCHENTWVARNDSDRSQLLFFRHAIPESVNMLIDKRKKLDPVITKLGTDMSVPDTHLRYIMCMYYGMLHEMGLQSAVWGHIGDNHVHVNILPRSKEDYNAGKRLYERWAIEVTKLGGAVSAEHGTGKLKANFLTVMYGQAHIDEMTSLKLVFDPKMLLAAGNMFIPSKEGERK